MFDKMDEDIGFLFMKALFNAMIERTTENITWYRYIPKSQDEKCLICNIKLTKGDKCRPLDCEHIFHAECIIRYADNVESACPRCKTPIVPLLATIEEACQFMKSHKLETFEGFDKWMEKKKESQCPK